MGKIGGLCVASCFVVAACASGAARRQRDRELAALRAKELARQVAQFEALWMHEVRSDSTYELHVPTLDGMMALVVAKGDELTVRGRICELESSPTQIESRLSRQLVDLGYLVQPMTIEMAWGRVQFRFRKDTILGDYVFFFDNVKGYCGRFEWRLQYRESCKAFSWRARFRGLQLLTCDECNIFPSLPVFADLEDMYVEKKYRLAPRVYPRARPLLGDLSQAECE